MFLSVATSKKLSPAPLAFDESQVFALRANTIGAVAHSDDIAADDARVAGTTLVHGDAGPCERTSPSSCSLVTAIGCAGVRTVSTGKAIF